MHQINKVRNKIYKLLKHFKGLLINFLFRQIKFYKKYNRINLPENLQQQIPMRILIYHNF